MDSGTATGPFVSIFLPKNKVLQQAGKCGLQMNKPQQWDFIPKSSELTYSAINVNLRFHNIEDPGDRTVNECQNGHKMVTKLWEIPENTTTTVAKVIEKARGGKVY